MNLINNLVGQQQPEAAPWFRVFRLCLWLLPISLFIWIVDQNLSFSGDVVLRCSAQHCDPEFRNFDPKDTDLSIGTKRGTNERYRLAMADPLYFDTQLMRSMDRADMKLTFQDPDMQRRLRLGVMLPGSLYQYYDLAEYDPNLSRVKAEWSAKRDGEVVIFQNPKSTARSFSSLDDLLADLPSPKKTVTHNIDVAAWARIAGYTPSPTPLSLTTSIRGSHTFLVYVGRNENLDLTFSVQDINRHEGKDTLSFSVMRGGDVLTTLILRDDGVASASGKPSSVRTLRLLVPNLEEGTYRIQIAADSDDAFIRSIRSSQKLLMFENRLYVAGSNEYRVLGETSSTPLTVYFRGTRLTVRTSHSNALQTVMIGSRRVTLSKPNSPVSVAVPEAQEFIPVTMPIQDVELSSPDGQFVLGPASAFPYRPTVYPNFTSVTDLSPYDYVIARYRDVQSDGSWSVAEQAIPNLPKSKTTHFFISGIPAIGQSGAPLQVKEIEVRLRGDRLTPRLALRLLRDLLSSIRRGNS